jgi:hypothetical protein
MKGAFILIAIIAIICLLAKFMGGFFLLIGVFLLLLMLGK